MTLIATWGEAEVIRIYDETPTVLVITLKPKQAARKFLAGAHIDVAVTINNAPATRSYSLVNQAGEGVYKIAVKKSDVSRGGSDFMWRLKTGMTLGMTDPKSSFELDNSCDDYLLIAGGIGITQILGMAMNLADKGANFRLLYAVKRQEDLAFLSDLQEKLGDRCEVFVSNEGARINFDQKFAQLSPLTQAAMCGPLAMQEAAKVAWLKAKKSAQTLRWETFGTSGKSISEPFHLKIPRHAIDIVVPTTMSILDILSQQGITVLADCKKGECGLCAMSVLSVDGTIDHRDVFFSDEQKAENHKICACVSRASGTLTLDSDYRG